jgi:tight adherence protein B
MRAVQRIFFLISGLMLVGTPAWAAQSPESGAFSPAALISAVKAGEIPPLLPLLILFTFLCLLEGGLLWLSNGERAVQRRLKKRLNYLKGLESRPAPESLLKSLELSGFPRLNQRLKRLKGLDFIKNLLVQANVEWPLGVFLLLTFFVAALGFGLGSFKWGPLGALGGFALGAFLPYYALVLKKKRRLKKFEKQLPEALDLLARGLKAGHAFAHGLQMVAEEIPAPLGLEFFKTFKEYNYGLNLNSALLNLCDRVGVRDLKFFTTAVIIQRETGGNLTEILEKIAALIRERFKLRNQVSALTAEGRLSGLVLIALPPLLALTMYQMNPDYVMVLKNHPLGRMMAMGALAFQLLGIIAIRKIVNIKA